jgi:beta-1,4-mannosyl-glycoprotein beta-1,4-N-acetylglucosaminyltransferase
MIYDCFIFFNELDLLEIRLNELNDVVDKFVIVECTESFSKNNKPLYYNENKNKFSEFHDKIIHIIVDDAPKKLSTKTESENRWAVEHFQRNCIERGLTECLPNDVILVSDVDEIPRPESITMVTETLQKENDDRIISFKQRFFYYFLNGLCVQGSKAAPWFGTTACLYKGFIGAEKMRMTKGSTRFQMLESGWHFSYLGGADSIAHKIESFSHSEFDNDNIKNRARINDRMRKGLDLFDRPGRPRQVYIEIDDSFPAYIRDNIKKFDHLINSEGNIE